MLQRSAREHEPTILFWSRVESRGGGIASRRKDCGGNRHKKSVRVSVLVRQNAVLVRYCRTPHWNQYKNLIRIPDEASSVDTNAHIRGARAGQPTRGEVELGNAKSPNLQALTTMSLVFM